MPCQQGDGEDVGDGELVDPASLSAYYGPWQTRAATPPKAEGGRVPRSGGRDNVEVPPFVAALPEGTVHLTHVPGISRICRKLGVDFAPAMAGFDVRGGGRSVPRLEGVVICAEHEGAVMAAYQEWARCVDGGAGRWAEVEWGLWDV